MTSATVKATARLPRPDRTILVAPLHTNAADRSGADSSCALLPAHDTRSPAYKLARDSTAAVPAGTPKKRSPRQHPCPVEHPPTARRSSHTRPHVALHATLQLQRPQACRSHTHAALMTSARHIFVWVCRQHELRFKSAAAWPRLRNAAASHRRLAEQRTASTPPPGAPARTARDTNESASAPSPSSDRATHTKSDRGNSGVAQFVHAQHWQHPPSAHANTSAARQWNAAAPAPSCRRLVYTSDSMRACSEAQPGGEAPRSRHRQGSNPHRNTARCSLRLLFLGSFFPDPRQPPCKKKLMR